MALERLSQVTQSGIVTGIVVSNASATGVLTATSEFNVGSGLTITSTSSTTTLTSDNVTITGNSFVDGSLGIGTDSVSLNTLSVGTNPRGYTSYALIHNPSGVGATTKSELSDNAALIIQPHATNSTHMAFGEVNGGAGMGIQVTNYAKNADWDICLNPFGGNVGVGSTDPQSRLDVAGEIRASGIAITESYPTIRPTINIDFANSHALDHRVNFVRASNATYVDYDGLIKKVGYDAPRFDHDQITGESLGLLLEQPRTNQFTRSEEFDNGAWSALNLTRTANQTTAPDGTTTADKIGKDSAATETVYFNDDTPITSGITYTQSIFVKAAEYSYFQIAPSTGFPSGHQNFDLVNGVLGSSDGTIDDASIIAYPNGWYRCTLTVTSNTTTSGRMVMGPTTSASAGRLDSVGGSIGDGIYVWGAQLESGSFPTSYIPTSGSSATRAVDSAYIKDDTSLGTGVLEYSVYVRGKLNSTENYGGISPALVSLGSASTERIRIPHNNVGAVEVYNGGSVQASFTIGDIGTTERKIALAVKKDDFALSFDGGETQTDTSGNIPSYIDYIFFGISTYDAPPPTYPSTCHIKEFRTYNKRLTNAQLKALTS